MVMPLSCTSPSVHAVISSSSFSLSLFPSPYVLDWKTSSCKKAFVLRMPIIQALARLLAGSPFDDRENQTRRMRRVMEDAIDPRSVVISRFAGDLPARVAVAVEAREVAARNLVQDAVARQKYIRCGPQVELELIDRVRFEEFGRCERGAVTRAG